MVEDTVDLDHNSSCGVQEVDVRDPSGFVGDVDPGVEIRDSSSTSQLKEAPFQIAVYTGSIDRPLREELTHDRDAGPAAASQLSEEMMELSRSGEPA